MKIFEIVSNKIIASDPCYSIPTWCQGIIENVKNGTWSAETESVNSWGKRIAELRIQHINAKKTNRWIEIENTFGVDSGQFGFFDFASYKNDESVKELKKYDFGGDFGIDEESGEDWYRACCSLTLGDEQWGVLPNGVVSSSGYGDGSYGVYGMKDENGEWCAFQVVFIDSVEDEDEE
jgi:hypothetical protein